MGYAVKMGYKVCIITGGRGKYSKTACGCRYQPLLPTAWTNHGHAGIFADVISVLVSSDGNRSAPG